MVFLISVKLFSNVKVNFLTSIILVVQEALYALFHAQMRGSVYTADQSIVVVAGA